MICFYLTVTLSDFGNGKSRLTFGFKDTAIKGSIQLKLNSGALRRELPIWDAIVLRPGHAVNRFSFSPRGKRNGNSFKGCGNWLDFPTSHFPISPINWHHGYPTQFCNKGLHPSTRALGAWFIQKVTALERWRWHDSKKKVLNHPMKSKRGTEQFAYANSAGPPFVISIPSRAARTTQRTELLLSLLRLSLFTLPS